jgi:hypothetical protein
VLDRELRNFVRATLGIQGAEACSMEQAKQNAAKLLGCSVPVDDEFNRALKAPTASRRRGRPPADGLSRRDAVAAVASYFEHVGARPEQAIIEAMRWLNVSVSRRVAKAAVCRFKSNTSLGQFEPQALWAYATFRVGTTLPLPKKITPARRRRGTKPELG